MGMVVIKNSTTFNPSTYGLGAGDTLNVICVGGGGAGESLTVVNDSLIKWAHGGNAGYHGSMVVSDSFVFYARGGGGSGGGYGAGGGGALIMSSLYTGLFGNIENLEVTYSCGSGGGSGRVEIGTVTLANANTIPVTIGDGGSYRTITRPYTDDSYIASAKGSSGGTTSFGTFIYAQGGEGGGYDNTSRSPEWMPTEGGGGGSKGGSGTIQPAYVSNLSDRTYYEFTGAGGGGGGYVIGYPTFGGNAIGGKGGGDFGGYHGEDGGYNVGGKGVCIVFW